MNDFRGTSLNTGDKVAFTYQSYSSSGIKLVEGIIIGFTPKKIRIAYTLYKREDTKLVFPHTVTKI